MCIVFCDEGEGVLEEDKSQPCTDGWIVQWNSYDTIRCVRVSTSCMFMCICYVCRLMFNAFPSL